MMSCYSEDGFQPCARCGKLNHKMSRDCWHCCPEMMDEFGNWPKDLNRDQIKKRAIRMHEEMEGADAVKPLNWDAH